MDTEGGRDWGGKEEEEDWAALREGDEGWTGVWEERWRLGEEGNETEALTGPWIKSLNSSSSSEKPALREEDEGWAWAWEEGQKVDEEVEASTGPWIKSLNSSSSSEKAGGREWGVTDGCDGDESVKMKK